MKMHSTAAREDEALNQLKSRLSVSASTYGHGAGSIDGFLLRFLRNKALNVEETIAKLKRRRDFESSLIALHISPHVVRTLRSGAFCLIGNDVMRRPVLYIRLSAYKPNSETQEAVKLTTTVLEYLHSLLLQSNSVHEFIILVNAQNVGWFGYKHLFEDLSVFTEKYFPEMIGLVLISGASNTVKQGFTSAVAKASTKFQNKVQFAAPQDLRRFIAPDVLPSELNGQHQLTSASVLDFAENVLRYWYNATTFIFYEMKGGHSRPLWQPLPTATALVGTIASDRRFFATRRPGSHSNRGGVELTRSLSVTPAAPATREPLTETFTDDGLCSVVSDTEFHFDPSADLHAQEPETLGSTPPSHSVNAREPEAPAGWAAELEQEKQRRIQLEHKVAQMQLGVTIADDTLTKLETTLRKMHEEVNVLVSQAIFKGKTYTTNNRSPSLQLLLEITDSELKHILQEKKALPAMAFAQPVDRKPSNGCVLM